MPGFAELGAFALGGDTVPEAPPIPDFPIELTERPTGQIFFTCSFDGRAIDTVTELAQNLAVGAFPMGGLSDVVEALDDSATFLISDSGYLSPQGDGLGQPFWRPQIATVMAVNRQAPVDPAASPAAASYGEMVIANPRQADGDKPK